MSEPFQATKDGPAKSPTSIEREWWTKGADEAAKSVSACLSLLEDQEKSRAGQLIRSLRLYGNSPLRGIHGLTPTDATVASGPWRDRVGFNLVQSVGDTATSKIGKNKPRPFYVTSAGDSKQQRKAKNRNKFLEGIFYENKAHDLGMQAFLDGFVLGDGMIKVFALHGRIRYERVHCSSLKVDELEGAYGFPRSMHEVRMVDKAHLAAAFPKKKKEILEAPNAWINDAAVGKPTISNMVLVRESWHLPSGPKAKDGRHLVSLDECALTPLDEWTHDFFPFARFSWAKKLVGFWAQGGAERLQSLQLEINKLMYKVQRSYELGASFKILMEMGSKIAPEHLNNQIGAVVKYTGAPPQYVVPPLIPPEVYQHLRWLIELGYQQEGVNQISAAGEIPRGMEKASGKALLTLGDQQSDRFQTQGRAYDDLFMQLATCTLAVAKDLFASGEVTEYEVKVPHPRWIERLTLKDVDLDEDDNFVMQCFPISALPTEPAGRMSTVTEMAQAGWIDQRTAKRLMSFPDLEQEETLSGAAEDYILTVLDKIVEEDDYEMEAPEPFDDLQLGFQLAQRYYLNGKRDKLDEEKLEKLRVYMSQCQAMMQAAQPPPMTGAAPGAVPAQPPVSPVLPNAPGAQA